jgi:hypothetical protein
MLHMVYQKPTEMKSHHRIYVLLNIGIHSQFCWIFNLANIFEIWGSHGVEATIFCAMNYFGKNIIAWCSSKVQVIQVKHYANANVPGKLYILSNKHNVNHLSEKESIQSDRHDLPTMHSFIHSVHRTNTKWTNVCQLTLFYVKVNKPEYVSRQMSCPMSGEASSSSEVLVSSLTFLSISCNSFCVSTETHTFKEDVTLGLGKII